MSVVLQPSTRGIRVIVNDKHLKTIPKKYSVVYLKVHPELSFEKKRINEQERKNLEIKLLFYKELDKIAHKQKALYELIKHSTPVAARKVITPEKERMELILENGIKLTTHNDRLFQLFPHTSDSYKND